MKQLRTIGKVRGLPVLLRVDLNVALDEKGKVRDLLRITRSLPTINYLRKKGAIVVLLSHLGEGGAKSLGPVAKALERFFPITFLSDVLESQKLKTTILNAAPGTVVLLENIRRYKGEMLNSRAFAKKLASLGHRYINDAFSVCHRRHASIVGLPKLLPAYAGFSLREEIEALEPVLRRPKKPFIFILGGAKFKTKLPLLRRYVASADAVVVGGAILNVCYRALGFEIGKSLVEPGYDRLAKKLVANKKLLLPPDVVVLRKGARLTLSADSIQKEDVVVDVGPKMLRLLAPILARAKLIVWNGPLGWYERGFDAATKKLGALIKKTKARVVVGGGDTAAVINKTFDGGSKRIFVSTGGGATLDYLANGTLPGIDVL